MLKNTLLLEVHVLFVNFLTVGEQGFFLRLTEDIIFRLKCEPLSTVFESEVSQRHYQEANKVR